MKLCFDSIEEIQEFVKRLKGTRGKGKDEDDGPQLGNAGGAPAPLMPPQGGTAFTSQQPTFQPPQGFPGGGITSDPAVTALVNRINAKVDAAIAGGQPADAVLTWFRGQCGAEAANATLDQIKTVFLPKLATATLENIAKLMNA